MPPTDSDPAPLVTLLTDFGLDDWYVAALEAILYRAVPGLRTIHIQHNVPPGDLETASFFLEAVWDLFPPCIHLVVVDPGVGGDRAILAVARGGSYFVAPDNGVLEPILDGALVRRVERHELFRPGPGNTFHGRDRFAPVAAYLAGGHPFADLGLLLEEPVRCPRPQPQRSPGRLQGRVRHVDGFGNLITDLPSRWLEGAFSARVGQGETHRLVSHYAELVAGEAGVIRGSLGTLELSLNGASLAEAWRVRRGADVVIELEP